MRGNIADHRQSKFEWAWKYGKQSYQAHTTQADVLAKAKASYTLTIVFAKGYKAQGV